MLKKTMLREISQTTHIVFLCPGTEYLRCAIHFAHSSTVNIFMNTSCDCHELSLHFISISRVHLHRTHSTCLTSILWFLTDQWTQIQTKWQIWRKKIIYIYITPTCKFVATLGLNMNSFYSLFADFNSQEKDCFHSPYTS